MTPSCILCPMHVHVQGHVNPCVTLPPHEHLGWAQRSRKRTSSYSRAFFALDSPTQTNIIICPSSHNTPTPPHTLQTDVPLNQDLVAHCDPLDCQLGALHFCMDSNLVQSWCQPQTSQHAHVKHRCTSSWRYRQGQGKRSIQH